MWGRFQNRSLCSQKGSLFDKLNNEWNKIEPIYDNDDETMELIYTLNEHMWQIYVGYKAGFPLIATEPGFSIIPCGVRTLQYIDH